MTLQLFQVRGKVQNVDKAEELLSGAEQKTGQKTGIVMNSDLEGVKTKSFAGEKWSFDY